MMAKGGAGGSLLPVPCMLACVLLGLPSMILQSIGILQLGTSFATGSSSSSSSSSSSRSTAGLVGVNEGLLVTGYVQFGVVPVPNLCVELRGYDSDGVSAAQGSSNATPDKGEATTTAGGHAWPDLGDTEPRFRQLQRTGKSDGSFVFVTPETGVTLVLAAYSNGGDHPDVVRVFADGPTSGGGGGGDKITFAEAEGQEEAVARGEVTSSSVFGVESGRLLMHIDLAGGEGLHAPEALWSAASRENDQSPCAQTEAASGTSSGTTLLPTLHDAPSQLADDGGSSRTEHDDHDDPPLAAAGGDVQASTQHFNRHWTSFLEWLVGAFDASGFGGNVDQATTALTALLHALYSYMSCVCRPGGASLWEAKGAVGELFWSGVMAAGHRVPECTLARSVWSSVIELHSLFARVSTELSNWLEPKSRELSAWCMEASTRLFSWLEVQSPVDLRAWWVVYWAKGVSIALLLGMLQEVFLVMYKVCCRSRREASVEPDDRGSIVNDDRRCSEPHHQEPATATKSMIGTFYGSDGRVSQLEIAKCCGPEEPATTERRKGRGGIFGAIWGRDGSKLAVEEGGVKDDRREEESDEFSSMFRALNESACTVMESNKDGGGGDGGDGASSVFVVTQQQSWS